MPDQLLLLLLQQHIYNSAVQTSTPMTRRLMFDGALLTGDEGAR